MEAVSAISVSSEILDGCQFSNAPKHSTRSRATQQPAVAGAREGADTALMTTVRAAVPADTDEVARLHIRSWQAAYRGLIAQDYLDGLTPDIVATQYTFGRIGLQLPSTVVAVDGSTICGLATTGLCRDLDSPNVGELMTIYVDPAYLRTGVGRALITTARERLRLVGVTAALLWVLDANVGARRFYERDGWRFDGTRRTVTFGDRPAAQLRYRRTPV
jgi:GNAT superfamily N-acetyltransferase